jgi:hypothetical protein
VSWRRMNEDSILARTGIEVQIEVMVGFAFNNANGSSQ